MGIGILYQDRQLLVIDKPAGVPVQTSYTRHLSPELRSFLRNLGLESKGLRLVHRLDKDTSGVLIIARSGATSDFLKQQFKQRQVKKVYLALVEGMPRLKQAIIDWPVGRHPKNPLKRAVRANGKPSQTAYRVVKELVDPNNSQHRLALLELRPVTGRTHQIRVHLAKLGCPVVGDRLYGRAAVGLNRHWLHAHKLTLKLPNGSTQTFTASLPAELSKYLKSYNKA